MDTFIPKRINNIYDKALTFRNIKAAYERTSKRKRPSDDLILFNLYLEDNILKIYQELKGQTYEIKKFHHFTIEKPKKEK